MDVNPEIDTPLSLAIFFFAAMDVSSWDKRKAEGEICFD
jgi:hypothetical protein